MFESKFRTSLNKTGKPCLKTKMKMTKERESKRERKRETEKLFFQVGEAEMA